MLLSSDTCIGPPIFGLASIGFADALSQLNPDVVLLVIVLFFRLSLFFICYIPVAHCHGGELTEVI